MTSLDRFLAEARNSSSLEKAKCPVSKTRKEPDHWKTVRLGDISQITMGQSPLSIFYNTEKRGLPFLQGKAEFTDLYPHPKVFCDKPAKVAPKGTILFSIRAPVGEVNIADRTYAIGRGLASIGIVEGDTYFWFYQLLHSREKIKLLGTGTTFEAINKPTLESLEFTIPPFPEQRAIARVLRAVQEVMQALRRELELERERKAALMHHLFRYGTRGEPTKQTEIGEIPQSWGVLPLGSLLSEPLKNGYSAPESEEDEGIRTLALSAVTQNDFSIRNTKKTRADEHKVKDLWLQPGDIFIERANTSELVGLAAIYEGPPNFAIYPDLLIRVRLIGHRIIPRFALEALLADFSRSYFRKHARGTAGNMPKIDHATVQRCPLPLPPLEEQKEIASISLLCSQQIALIEQELALYQELFRTLLEELMSGRLSVQPLLEQEPALDT